MRDLERAPGLLIALGGLTDRVRERDLLRAFYEASGGPDASLVVLAMAAEPAEVRDLGLAAERFGDVFYDLGAESVEVLRLGSLSGRSRLDLLEFATGLFLAGGGGSPSWLPLSGELELGELVRRRHQEGMAVGGNGAGAAVLAERCIAPASPSANPGRRRPLGLSPGLGLAPGMLLDCPVRQRDRLSRLLNALAVDTTPLALGIDEDTAVLLEPQAGFEVLGAGAVTVINAAQASSPGTAPGAEVPPMLGLKVDILTDGCRYDLRERRAVPGRVHGSIVANPGEWRT